MGITYYMLGCMCQMNRLWKTYKAALLSYKMTVKHTEVAHDTNMVSNTKMSQIYETKIRNLLRNF